MASITFFVEEPKRPVHEYAFLVPITESDIERLPVDDFRSQLAQGTLNVAAQYNEGSHAIYLPPKKLSTLGKGILLLHEGMHARLDLEDQIDRETEDSHWFEEADVFKFEFALLAKLMGNSYSDLIGRVSETISGTEDNPSTLSAFYGFTEEDRRIISNNLDTSNAQEVDFWLNVVKINAFWEYFKVQFENPDAELAQMLKAMYIHEV